MKDLFKIGEISRLYHIGTDSLRYYEELGILTPTRGENGYRLYRLCDLWRLNVIRDMRELDFSMEQIKNYLAHRSIASTEKLLEDELNAINSKIALLNGLKEDVETRISTLQESKLQVTEQVQQITLKDRRCYSIHSGYETDEEMDMLIKRLLNRDPNSLYIIGNNRIGSVISLDKIKEKKYRGYKSVFIIDEAGDEILKGGTYLTLSYHGPCQQNAIYIPKLINYAKKQNLTPVDSVLELLWVDIHQSENPAEHITELQMLCSPL
ncbi:MAG: MerR family transcriptional regulator [Lachnospiraceae bacterium]